MQMANPTKIVKNLSSLVHGVDYYCYCEYTFDRRRWLPDLTDLGDKHYQCLYRSDLFSASCRAFPRKAVGEYRATTEQV